MRIDLSPGGEGFSKQVAQIRRGLAPIADGDTQQAASARVALAVFVPFLTALRTELRREDINPVEVFGAVSDVCANLAVSTMQSMIEATPEVVMMEVEKLLHRATKVAAQSIAAESKAEAEHTRAKLDLIIGGRPDGPVSAIHDQRVQDAESTNKDAR